MFLLRVSVCLVSMYQFVPHLWPYFCECISYYAIGVVLCSGCFLYLRLAKIEIVKHKKYHFHKSIISLYNGVGSFA